MRAIKEDLKRIKRGELQFFIPLVEKYLASVYNVAQKKYSKEKAENITIKIFLELFKNIVTWYKWQSPEKFIQRSLRRSCRRYGFKWDFTSIPHDDYVPQQILRQVLISLSKSSKRKSKLKLVITSLSIIVILVGSITVYLNVRIESTKGSIYTDTYYSPSVIVDTYTNTFLNPHGPFYNQLYQLLGDATLIDTVIGDRNTDEFIRMMEIWNEGKKEKSFSVDGSAFFIVGDYYRDCYTFKFANSLKSFDGQGNLIISLNIAGNIKNTSSNNQYIAIQQTDGNIIIVDALNMVIKDTIRGDLLYISNYGYVFYENESTSTLPRNINRSKRIVSIDANENGDTLVIYGDASIGLYNGDRTIWEIEGELYDENGKVVESSNLVKDAYSFLGDKHVIVLYTEQGVCYQVIDSVDGQVLNNLDESKRSGSLMIEPIRSNDERIFLVGNRYSNGDKYSNGNRYNGNSLENDYLGLVDIESKPLRNYVIARKWDVPKSCSIEKTNNGYIVYLFNINQLKIINVELK